MEPQTEHLVDRQSRQKDIAYLGRRYPQCRVLFEVRKNVSVFAVSGYGVVGPGTYEIVLDEPDAKALLAHVEDAPEEIAAAKRIYERHLAAAIEKKHGAGWRSRSDAEKLEREADARTGDSVEAQFFKLTGRSIRPLVSAEIVESGLPPFALDNDVSAAQTEHLATAIARAVKAK